MAVRLSWRSSNGFLSPTYSTSSPLLHAYEEHMATTESQQVKTSVNVSSEGNGATFGISGWTEVVKTVRDADAVKVTDAKEDIDNLLVFAGLFSAILTAFLIEAYHALQPDTESEMLFLLHRIATQNYTISSGFLNTSSPFPVREPFQAPTWAVRVNGLWFASLIFSLAAASLGILVKAWLREYLASQWMSPQEKLRSRQYRYPALIKWKVFEISAILPLLLQLALGLFFVGLCLFTASFDRRIALTSIPLVSGWAFFLIATTIAPVFNPRCPFKVPGLRRALQSIRRHLLPRLFRLHQSLSRQVPKLKSSLSTRVHHLLSHCPSERPIQLREFLSSLRKKMPRREALSPDSLSHPSAPLLPLTSTATATPLPLSLQEEEDVVSGVRDEAEVLLDADKLISQDSLLPLFIAAFRQTRPTPAQSAQFILRLMRHRLPTLPDVDPSRDHQLDCIVDLTGLSQRAYSDLMLFALSHIQTTPSTDSLEGVCDILLILLSKSTFPYPAHVPAVINTFLAGLHHAQMIDTTISVFVTRMPPAFMTGVLVADLPSMTLQLAAISTHRQIDMDADSDTSIYFSLTLYRIVLSRSTTALKWQLESPGLLGAFRSSGPGLVKVSIARPTLDDLWEYLDRTLNVLLGSESQGLPHNISEALGVVMHLAPQLGHVDEAAYILRLCFSAWQWAYMALQSFTSTLVTAVSEVQGSTVKAISPISERMWTLASEDAAHTILIHSRDMMQIYIDGGYPPAKADQLDLVAFTHAYLRMYASSDKGHLVMWEQLWVQTQIGLRKYWDDKSWAAEPISQDYLIDGPYHGDIVLKRDREIAEESLWIIELLDIREDSGEVETSSIPDELVHGLGLFILPDRVSAFPRLARLWSSFGWSLYLDKSALPALPCPNWSLFDANSSSFSLGKFLDL